MSARNLADSIIRETEQRVMAQLGSAAYLNYSFGSITMLSGSGATVQLDDRANPISGVKTPKYAPLDIGDRVRVATDSTGDAYITEVY